MPGFWINAIIDAVALRRRHVHNKAPFARLPFYRNHPKTAYVKVLHRWGIKRTSYTAKPNLVSLIRVDHTGMLVGGQFISSSRFQNYRFITTKSKSFLDALKDKVCLNPIRVVC